MNGNNDKVVKRFNEIECVINPPVKVLNRNRIDQVTFNSIPTLSSVKQVEDTSKIAWNRWTTDKFSIHALNKDIGLYLYNNVEEIKQEVNNNWGIPSFDFEHEIRIFCCPSETTLHKLFNINKTSFEYKEDKKVIYVWLVLNDSNLESLKSLIMSVSLIELEYHYKYTFPLWIHRGMPLLSVNSEKVKESLAFITETNKVRKVDNLIKTDYSEYGELDEVSKKSFDISSSLLCLMIRKEFGQNNFHKCMLKNVDIVSYLRFKDAESFGEKYRQYCGYLRNDYLTNKINENYLIIRPKE